MPEYGPPLTGTEETRDDVLGSKLLEAERRRDRLGLDGPGLAEPQVRARELPRLLDEQQQVVDYVSDRLDLLTERLRSVLTHHPRPEDPHAIGPIDETDTELGAFVARQTGKVRGMAHHLEELLERLEL